MFFLFLLILSDQLERISWKVIVSCNRNTHHRRTECCGLRSWLLKKHLLPPSRNFEQVIFGLFSQTFYSPSSVQCCVVSSESLRYSSVREVFKTTNLLGEPQDVYRSHSLLASSPRSIQGRRACSHVLGTWVPPLEPSVVPLRLSCQILVNQREAKMHVDYKQTEKTRWR